MSLESDKKNILNYVLTEDGNLEPKPEKDPYKYLKWITIASIVAYGAVTIYNVVKKSTKTH